jgi:hypothetical protein
MRPASFSSIEGHRNIDESDLNEGRRASRAREDAQRLFAEQGPPGKGADCSIFYCRTAWNGLPPSASLLICLRKRLEHKLTPPQTRSLNPRK